MAAENFKVKKGLEVGTGITANSDGVNVTGIVTATQFKGDGSGLTGVVGSGSGIVVKDEGSAVGTAGTVNFVGSGVAATLSAGTATVTINAGGLDNVVEDTTPQLGGNLDLNSKFVTGSGGINVTGVVTATTLKGAMEATTASFSGAIDANGDLDVDGHTELDNLNVAGVSTFSNGINLSSGQLTVATSIKKASGTLDILADTIELSNADANSTLAQFTNGAAAKLYFAGNQKLTTTINGIEVPDLNVTGVGTVGRLETSGVTLGTNNNTFAAKFIDDAVANFGTDNDLKISHDDTHARITNTKGNIVVSGIISATSDVKVGSAITMDPTSGIITATSFSGSGSGLTSIPSAQLSGALPALDGSALTGVTASGSGVVVKHDGSTVGTAGTINFSTNLDVSAISAGIVTVTASGGGGFSQDSQGNLVAGTNAGSSLDGSSAEYNILLGQGAGESIDGDDNNIIIGYDAGKNNTASNNIIIGRDAAKTLNSSLSSQNVFIGHEAVYNKANISGTVVGAQAGLGNGTGINLTLFGYRAGGNSYNSTTFIGHQAGRSATSACDFTTAVGANALYNNAGTGNVAIGNDSGQVLTSGEFNTLAGYKAGRGNLSGTINYTDCVAIGSSAAMNLSSANNVIVIGANANPSSNTVTNEITLGNANITKLRVPGIGLTFTSVGAEISGIVTATTFSGSGASLTTLNASELDSGTIPNGRFPATLPAVSGANLTALNASEITSGTLPIARIDDDAVTFAKMQNVGTGVLIGRNDSGTGDIETLTAAEARTLLNVADGATAGITTTAWTVGHSGASNYVISGPGGLSNANNPDLHLIRGQTYQFIVNASGHGFGIQTSSGTWNSSNAYTTGITNAGAAVGTITFRVPYSAPGRLYYACTSQHSGMVGNIYISGGGGVVTYEGAKELQLGNTTGSSVNSSNLVNINLGGTYHDTAGSFGKLKLYDDGSNEISFGVSNNSCDFILTSGNWGYNFYGGNSGATRLMSLNQTGNIQLLLGNESTSGVAAPLSINLGGTYSDADGNGNDLSAKLKLWTDGSNLMGLSVSDNQLDYIVTSQNYDHVFYGGNAGTTELARFEGTGSLLINSPAEAAGKIGIKGTNSNGSTCYAVTNSGKALQGIDITCTTVGDGNYGGGISFGCGGNGRSAIAAVQDGSDDDRNGLSFFVHPSTTGSNNTVEKLRLEADGNLALGGAIGNSNIKGSSGTGNEGVYLVAGNPSQFAASNTSVMALNRKTSEGRVFEVRYNGSVRGYFDTDGSSLPSDKNYKTDISDLSLGLSFVNKLKPSKFRYKDSESTSPILYGLIAQDVEESLTSEGVSKNSTKMLQYKVIEDDDNESDYYLDYGKLTPVLINAIKELSTEIDKLKAEIAALKSS